MFPSERKLTSLLFGPQGDSVDSGLTSYFPVLSGLPMVVYVLTEDARKLESRRVGFQVDSEITE